jgi:bacterioferritin
VGNNGVGNNGMVKEVTRPTGMKTRRSRIRRGIEDRTRTLGDKARGHKVIRLLNKALAIEIACILRYKRHYFMAAGLSSFSAKAEFLHHAMEEQVYADPLAERIVQLGGELHVSPEGFLNRSHPEYVEGESLREMITEDLHAKRITINSYRELVASLGTDDPVTSTILENILMQKEEHVADRASLLTILGPESKSHHSKR